MNEETAEATKELAGHWNVPLIVGFSAVFVVGFAVIAVVVLSRRRPERP